MSVSTKLPAPPRLYVKPPQLYVAYHVTPKKGAKESDRLLLSSRLRLKVDIEFNHRRKGRNGLGKWLSP